jgi:superfamily I DNA/RNA helicase
VTLGNCWLPSEVGTGTSAEIEEERRLLYVAMARAKDDLNLIVPQRFFTYGYSAQGDRHLCLTNQIHSRRIARPIQIGQVGREDCGE